MKKMLIVVRLGRRKEKHDCEQFYENRSQLVSSR